ncbi:MAG: hypothetical protein HON04_16960 [Planctomicrobium sp.]|jgi:hypothetical protein|nr:hypothetical protein [Planctomicrobium sp.]
MLEWKPKLSGWLAILNCVAWLLFAVFADEFENFSNSIMILITALLFLFSLPFAWWLMFPALHHQSSAPDIIWTCILLGVNSFAWGYGLAAIIRYSRRKTNQTN